MATPQRAHRSWRANRVRPCLPDGARGDRVEAKGLAIQIRPLARLAQDEESGVRSGEARGRGRLGADERGPRPRLDEKCFSMVVGRPIDGPTVCLRCL